MRLHAAFIALAFTLGAAATAQARSSASTAAARKAKKDAGADPSRWFATRQGLLRVYQDRNADKQIDPPDDGSTSGNGAPPPTGASCEVIESTPKDGDTAARTRESCTMITGRMSKGSTQLTYELRPAGIFLVEVKSEGPHDPTKMEQLLLPSPVRKGKSWSEVRGAVTYLRTVKSAGKPCKTADRKFGDCLVIGVSEKSGKKVKRKYTETYAAGVGLVEDAHWELIDVKGL